MKVKAELFLDEDYRKIKEDWRLQQTLKELRIDLKNPPYIELDTGGQFDDISKEAQENLKKALATSLGKFGRLLLAAVNFDISAHLQGAKELFGFKAIVAGLKEMAEQMEIAKAMSSSSSSSDKSDKE